MQCGGGFSPPPPLWGIQWPRRLSDICCVVLMVANSLKVWLISQPALLKACRHDVVCLYNIHLVQELSLILKNSFSFKPASLPYSISCMRKQQFRRALIPTWVPCVEYPLLWDIILSMQASRQPIWSMCIVVWDSYLPVVLFITLLFMIGQCMTNRHTMLCYVMSACWSSSVSGQQLSRVSCGGLAHHLPFENILLELLHTKHALYRWVTALLPPDSAGEQL